ncbi:hypothetical protein Lal_00046202, partial [Lupinus albus]
GDNISCTLWGQFASQLLKYEENHKLGSIVLILTLAKIQETKCYITFSIYPVTIQNTMYCSKLFINNNNIHEIQVFTNTGSQDKFFHNAVVRIISKLIHIGHESICVTYDIIEKLFANGWYYDECPKAIENVMQLGYYLIAIMWKVFAGSCV